MLNEKKISSISELRDITKKIRIKNLINNPDKNLDNQKLHRALAIVKSFDSIKGDDLEKMIDEFIDIARAKKRLPHANNLANNIRNFLLRIVEEMEKYNIEEKQKKVAILELGKGNQYENVIGAGPDGGLINKGSDAKFTNSIFLATKNKKLSNKKQSNKKKYLSFASIISVLAIGIAYIIAIYQIEPNIHIDTSNTPTQEEEISNIIRTSNSKVDLALKNNFIGIIYDVDIKISTLNMFVDEQTNHINVCPFGYIYNISNKEFISDDNSRTLNSLNQKFKLFPQQKHIFTTDYNKIYQIMKNNISPAKGNLKYKLIKIDVNYIKWITNDTYNYSKIYLIYNKDTLIDLDKNKKLIGFNDKKNEMKETVSSTEISIPSLVYPFQQTSFIKKINELKPPFHFLSTECLEFTLDKQQNIINY